MSKDKKEAPKAATEEVAKEVLKEYSGEVISEFKTIGTKGKGNDAKAIFTKHEVGSVFKTTSKKGFERLQNNLKIKK